MVGPSAPSRSSFDPESVDLPVGSSAVGVGGEPAVASDSALVGASVDLDKI